MRIVLFAACMSLAGCNDPGKAVFRPDIESSVRNNCQSGDSDGIVPICTFKERWP